MPNYKYVIIGGGAAGVSAAETIRTHDKNGTIAVISDEPYPLYSRVMLSKPNFFLGKIPFDSVYMKGKEWYAENHIDFLGSKKAVSLDVNTKTISLSDVLNLNSFKTSANITTFDLPTSDSCDISNTTTPFTNSSNVNLADNISKCANPSASAIQYEKLLIATGVNAKKWPVVGADKDGIHYLRTLEDGKGIMDGIKKTKKAITIGGGFISFEMADMLHLAGLDTTSIIIDSYFWQPILDEASGLMLENAMIKAGVKVLKNTKVTEVVGDGKVEGIKTCTINPSFESKTSITNNDGQTTDSLPCEMIVCGIGTTNPIEWLENTGVKTNRGILADETMQTSEPSIWTAGDIAEYKDLLLEENIEMGNWVSAKEQGRIAGINMMISADIQNNSADLAGTVAGVSGVADVTANEMPTEKQTFKFVSFYTTQGFGVNIAFVGDVNVAQNRIIIPRGSPEINSYGRLIIAENGELIGATLLNRTNEMNTIAKIIEKNIKVIDKQKELGDVNFDLKNLLEV